MRLSKEQNKKYCDYILSCIDSSDHYPLEPKTDKDKVRFVVDCFVNEKWSWQKKQNINLQNAFTEYLQGLPTCLTLAFYNSDIIKLAEEVNGEVYGEKQADKILENYWLFMTAKFFKLAKSLKIDIWSICYE